MLPRRASSAGSPPWGVGDPLPPMELNPGEIAISERVTLSLDERVTLSLDERVTLSLDERVTLSSDCSVTHGGCHRLDYSRLPGFEGRTRRDPPSSVRLHTNIT